jgi:hypothetical protein
MYFSDYFQQDQNSPTYVAQPPTVRLFNSLLSGTLLEEITLAKPSGSNKAIDTSYIQNNYIFGKRNNALPISNIYSNVSRVFEAPSFYDFRPDSATGIPNSQAGLQISKFAYLGAFGYANVASGIYTDFVCQRRDANTPDIGAYQKKR